MTRHSEDDVTDEVTNRVNNGSMGHGSMGQMGQFFGWVIWVMGRCTFTHDPLAYLPGACS